MRWLGIMIMAGTAAGGGFYAAQTAKECLEILIVISQMIHHLMGRVLQTNDPLPQAFQEVGQRFWDTQKGKRTIPAMMFLQVAERLKNERGTGFSKIWRDEITVLSGKVSMRKSDVRNLEELGAFLGHSDRKMQEKIFQFYLEQTRASVDELKAEIHTKTKLYRSLGLAAGIFLFVFLI